MIMTYRYKVCIVVNLLAGVFSLFRAYRLTSVSIPMLEYILIFVNHPLEDFIFRPTAWFAATSSAIKI